MHRCHFIAFGRTIHETEDCHQRVACQFLLSFWILVSGGPSPDSDPVLYGPGPIDNQLSKYLKCWRGASILTGASSLNFSGSGNPLTNCMRVKPSHAMLLSLSDLCIPGSKHCDSEHRGVNKAAATNLLSTLPFKVSKKGFTYLGVVITDKFNKLFESNFETLFTRVKDDLHRWSSLPLSLAGRINLVKMTVLPKFLYLFQCIPAFIPKDILPQIRH